jgi:hypothetical protein
VATTDCDEVVEKTLTAEVEVTDDVKPVAVTVGVGVAVGVAVGVPLG